MKSIIIVVLGFLCFSCSSKKDSINNLQPISNRIDFSEINCLENIKARWVNDIKGPIKLELKIDSIIYGTNVLTKKYKQVFSLGDSSKMIYLDTTVAINFFHVETTEYNKPIHLLKFDFFMNNGSCWERKHSYDYTNIESLSSIGVFSRGYPNTQEYFKVVWSLNRIL